MTGMESFFTRERSNEGTEIPLYLPSGEKSDHWIRIRGVDSDIFREVEAEVKREAVRVAVLEDEDEKKKKIAEAKVKLIACLIMSWSFEEECNQENILRLLKEAPQIMDMIDKVATKRSLFFGLGLSSSPDTPSTTSSST